MKTGLIYCPKREGFKSPEKRWKKIAECLESHGIKYDLVQSENAQSVERLVSMLIHNGYDDIIICGGDAALCDAVNCLMREEKEVRERVVLSVIPNGLMNDFAAFWGLTENDIKLAVESIATRRIKKVDAGCFIYTDKEGNKRNRYFLNCINIGLVAGIQHLRTETRRIFWSRKVSYVISLVLLLFQRMFWKMEYTINYETEQHRVMTMCIGSALGFGQTPNAVPYNGMIDVTVIRNSALTQLFSVIALFVRGRILNHKMILPYRCHDITIKVPKNTPVSIDGHSFSDIDTSTDPMKIIVEQEAINFIIEK